MAFLSSTNNFFSQLSSGDIGFFLPFFFVFAVTFALLSSVGKTAKIDALKNGPVNIIISIVFGLLAATNEGFSRFFFDNGPTIIFVIIGLFTFAFLLEVLGLRGKSGRKAAKNNPMIMIIISGLALLGLGLVFTFIENSIKIPGIGTANLIMILSLIFIGAIFIFSYKMGEEKSG